ncbi:SGNH/GDSL hydrolase family protein [Sphingomonas sp. MS122]|uniref:SGNH/GDSL hydrolase family protein n=1 Tax=Sphingomonas sp. MS122 TaxID=3412683 RepID=UPI003C2F6B64
MKRRILLASALLLAVGGCSGGTKADPPVANPTPTLTPPPTVAIRGEARMLSGTAQVSFLHRAARVGAVYGFGADGRRIDYVATDYVATETGIARTPGSRIPDFAAYTYVRSVGDKFDFVADPRNPPLTINHAVYVDYDGLTSDRQVRAVAPSAATGKVLCLGDSIAAGAHTAAQFYSGNDSQSWCGLIRKFLGPASTVENVSVPGAVVGGALGQLDDLVARRADTAVIAYGMNDHISGGVDAAQFRTDLDTVVGRLKAEGVRVILVGFFQRNPLYALEDPARTAAFNEAIRLVAQGRGVALVDVQAGFPKAAPAGAPVFTHLTADFLHHPNVYGQRVYFSLIVPHFLKRDMWASEIEDYVLADW